MGYAGWDSDSYKSLSSSYESKSRDEVFEHKEEMCSDMNPKDLKFRESRDSERHPKSIAIIVALDETGSMSTIPEIIVREKLGGLMDTLVRNGIDDSHVLFMGIGDHISDRFPLQVGQFEADAASLAKWLTSINLEGGGGPYGDESYLLAWLIAGRHTSIDCFEKRNEKGYLFTIGDESCHSTLDAKYLKKLLGYGQAETLTAEQLLLEAQRLYNVFHIHINHHGSRESTNENYWKKMLGQNLIVLDDYKDICEVMASTIAILRGRNITDVVKDFDAGTAKTVTTAVARVTNEITKSDNKSSVIKL